MLALKSMLCRAERGDRLPYLLAALKSMLHKPEVAVLERKRRKEFARTEDARIQEIHRRLCNRLHKVLTRRKQHQIGDPLENLGTNAASNYSPRRITNRYKSQASQKSVLGLSLLLMRIIAADPVALDELKQFISNLKPKKKARI